MAQGRQRRRIESTEDISDNVSIDSIGALLEVLHAEVHCAMDNATSRGPSRDNWLVTTVGDVAKKIATTARDLDRWASRHRKTPANVTELRTLLGIIDSIAFTTNDRIASEPSDEEASTTDADEDDVSTDEEEEDHAHTAEAP